MDHMLFKSIFPIISLWKGVTSLNWTLGAWFIGSIYVGDHLDIADNMVSEEDFKVFPIISLLLGDLCCHGNQRSNPISPIHDAIQMKFEHDSVFNRL